MPPVVIGAGITGLVAAFELVKRGERPIVIEPERVGGMIRSVSRDGFTLETGPNVVVERPDLAALVQELGLQHLVRYPSVPNYGQYVWARNRIMKVPSGPKELFTSSLFSLSTKLSLPFKIFRPNVLKARGNDCSVLEFFAPILGERTAREMLDPVLKGIYGGDVDRLSARTIFPGLWDCATRGGSIVSYMKSKPKGGKPSILVMQGGLESLVSTLAEKLRAAGVEFRSCAVNSIARQGGGSYALHCSDGSSVQTDRCVVTVAGEPLCSLLEPHDSGLTEKLRAMRYASLTVVHASVPRSEKLIPNAFGILFPGGMPENVLGVMFNSLIFPHVAPPDRHIITVMVGGAQASTLPEPAWLKEKLPPLLESLLRIRGFKWIESTQWKDAIPQLVVGHYAVVEACDQFERTHPGIVLAGVQRGGVGVSDRIKAAREIVARLMAEPAQQAA